MLRLIKYNYKITLYIYFRNSAYVTLGVNSRSQARIKEEGCVRSSATNIKI
ncbi:uncharacterized protein DS421_10g307430 [Arachis hypogaea]|nr:uncharacterized protein DS421_10g307430 [Arachis hypogaea]